MALIMVAVFLISAVYTVAFAAKPGCQNCRKTDCPTGYCYVDCESCCYLFHGQIYCFK